MIILIAYFFFQYFDIFVDLGSCECEPLDRYKPCQDIFSNEFLVDPGLKGIQLTKLKSLYYRLIARGAIVADHLHAEVTHIVMFKDYSTLDSSKSNEFTSGAYIINKVVRRIVDKEMMTMIDICREAINNTRNE